MMTVALRLNRFKNTAVWKPSTLSARFVSAKTAVGTLTSVTTALAFAASASAQSVPTATKDTFSIGTGYSVWHGDFGAPTKTLIWSALVDARYQTGGLRLTAVLPRMRIRSDGAFFAGLGGTPLFAAPNIKPARRVREGWGDVTLGAAYLLPGGGERGFDLELNGRAKLPTATKSSQLSTGKADYSGGVELSTTRGNFTPAVSANYRVFGDTKTWHFQNGFYVTAGGSYAITPRTAVLLTYEYTQAASRFIGDAHEVVLGASTPLTQGLRLTAYASKGLSQGASDLSAGAHLSLAL